MKKVILGLVAMLGFVSCSNDFETFTTEEIVTNNYNAAFINTFGEPAANQDWGFGTRELPSSFMNNARITRAAQPNGNQWGTTDDNSKYLNWPQPKPITEQERDSVLAVFNQKGDSSYVPIVHWENYFVQQVYTGPNGWKMNELASVTDMVNKSYWPLTYEHTGVNTDDIINNFNKGNCTAWDGCMLMWFSSTKDFSFKTSQSGGQRIYGHWRMEEINGNCYVGFDHEAWRQAPANANEEDKRDYVYNDWIVKLIPGKGISPRYSVRIICEDLTANGGSDFDFNDVVFDVSYTEGSNVTIVTIQCAGGTLPLFVDGREVHNLFAKANPDKAITEKTMINTHASNGINGLEPVSFTIDHIVAPWDITVAVKKMNDIVPLKATVGSPAAKIAVDPSFKWVNERVDIRTVYPNFINYVKDTSVDWY